MEYNAILVFKGSFAPFHYGHYLLIEEGLKILIEKMKFWIQNPKIKLIIALHRQEILEIKFRTKYPTSNRNFSRLDSDSLEKNFQEKYILGIENSNYWNFNLRAFLTILAFRELEDSNGKLTLFPEVDLEILDQPYSSLEIIEIAGHYSNNLFLLIGEDSNDYNLLKKWKNNGFEIISIQNRSSDKQSSNYIRQVIKEKNQEIFRNVNQKISNIQDYIFQKELEIRNLIGFQLESNFLISQMLIITGISGIGKTSILNQIIETSSDIILRDSYQIIKVDDYFLPDDKLEKIPIPDTRPKLDRYQPKRKPWVILDQCEAIDWHRLENDIIKYRTEGYDIFVDGIHIIDNQFLTDISSLVIVVRGNYDIAKDRRWNRRKRSCQIEERKAFDYYWDNYLYPYWEKLEKKIQTLPWIKKIEIYN